MGSFWTKKMFMKFILCVYSRTADLGLLSPIWAASGHPLKTSQFVLALKAFIVLFNYEEFFLNTFLNILKYFFQSTVHHYHQPSHSPKMAALAQRPFNDYVAIILTFKDHLPTSTWTFLTLNVDKNRDFLDQLHTTSFCPRSHWMAPYVNKR